MIVCKIIGFSLALHFLGAQNHQILAPQIPTMAEEPHVEQLAVPREQLGDRGDVVRYVG